MIPEKRIIRRIQSGGCAIHCQDCSISQLCIPFTLNEHELDQLDNIIERKKPIQKGQTLFKAGDELKSLYAIRSGTIKSYTITEQGDEQITGFHLAGDLVGFDAIGSGHHPSFAQALETSLGNTAEQVIDHLRCDLLVIKPDEYQTPVELDDEDD